MAAQGDGLSHGLPFLSVIDPHLRHQNEITGNKEEPGTSRVPLLDHFRGA
jgi:hypothetical protein